MTYDVHPHDISSLSLTFADRNCVLCSTNASMRFSKTKKLQVLVDQNRETSFHQSIALLILHVLIHSCFLCTYHAALKKEICKVFPGSVHNNRVTLAGFLGIMTLFIYRSQVGYPLTTFPLTTYPLS